MALVGVELETLVSEPDALTTRPPQIVQFNHIPDAVKYIPVLLFYDERLKNRVAI